MFRLALHAIYVLLGGPALIAAPVPMVPRSDALPPGAVLRLGSPKFRHPQATLTLSADGKRLITYSTATKSIRIWETETGGLVKELRFDTANYLSAMAWAPDDKTFVTLEMDPGNANRQTECLYRVWDAITGEPLRVLPRRSKSVYCDRPIRYLADGKRIVAQSDAGFTVWDVTTGEELAHQALLASTYTEFGVSADGKRIAVVAATGRGQIHVWDWETAALPRLVTFGAGVDFRFRAVEISADGKRLALASDSLGPIRVFDAADGKLLHELRVPDQRRMFYRCAFTPDGKRVLAVDDGGYSLSGPKAEAAVVAWDVETGKVERRLTDHRVAKLAIGGTVAVSADGKVVACQGTGFPAWNLATGERLCPLTDAETTFAHEVVAGGDFLLTLSDGSPAWLWDAKTGRSLFALSHDGRIRAGAISPDGHRAATSANDDVIRVWDTATGKAVLTLPGHGNMNGTTALQFSADGQTLTSFGTDFYLRVTDLKTGKATREFAIRPAGLAVPDEADTDNSRVINAVFSSIQAALSSDGAQLALAGVKGYHTFDAKTGKERSSLAGTESNSYPAFSPDGNRLIALVRAPSQQIPVAGGLMRSVGATEHPLACWDLTTGKEVWRQTIAAKSWIGRGSFTPDGRGFAFSPPGWEKPGELRFHDTATGKEVGKLDGLPSSTSGRVTFTPDGKRVAVVMADGTVLVYPVPALKTAK